MRWSIRVRMILAMNALVAAVGVAVGYAGIEVATRQIERKLVHESASNAAELIGRQSWPLDSDALMSQVAQILGAEAAAGPVDAPEVLSASLPAEQRGELAAQLASSQAAGPPVRVSLGGRLFRLGVAEIRRAAAPPDERARRLYLLVPERQIAAAVRRTTGGIAVFTVVAVVIATIVGFWISTSITRPVRELAERMDHLAGEGTDAPAAPPAGRGRAADKLAAPPELAKLTRSFDELLTRLAAAQRQLDRSARLATLGQLAAAVAHELRNPLSGIRMNAQVLADELGRDAGRDRSLQLIIREIERMDLYLQELLDLASASAPDGAQGPPAEVGAVRLEELAGSVAGLLAGRLAHAGVTVETDYDASAPPALAEAGKVRQVVLNLQLNALDAMPHGGRMGLATRRVERGVRFEVADTGRGVQIAGGADIFEPFVTTKPQGSGLGLYVCRQVVTAFGGRVGYETRSDGSTFWFELPAAPEGPVKG